MLLAKLFRRKQATQSTDDFNRCLNLFDLTLISITSSIGSGYNNTNNNNKYNYRGLFLSKFFEF
jgi:hypothetical protein